MPPLSDDEYWLKAIRAPEFDEITAEALVELAIPGFSDVAGLVQERLLTRLCGIAAIVVQPMLKREFSEQRRWDLLQTVFSFLMRSLREPTGADFRSLSSNFAARVARFYPRARDEVRKRQDGASYAAQPAQGRADEPPTAFRRLSRLNDRVTSDAGASARLVPDDQGSSIEGDPVSLLLLAQLRRHIEDEATWKALVRRMTWRSPDEAPGPDRAGRVHTGLCSWAEAGRPFGIEGQTLQNRVEQALRRMGIERRKAQKGARVGEGSKAKSPKENK